MANIYWKETPSDTSYTNTANWVGGAAPTAADDVFVLNGSGDIAGSDQSATALASFNVGPNYSGSIGASGSPLILDTAACRINHAGTSGEKIWLSLQDASAGAGGDIPVDIEGGPATSSPTTEGIHIASNSTQDLTPIRIRGGVVTIEDSTEAQNIYITTPRNGSAPEVYIGASLSGTLSLWQTAGTCEAESSFGTINLAGGTLTIKDANHTTVNVYGGSLIWKNETEHTVTTLNGFAGTITATGARAGWTITNCTLYDADFDARAGIGEPTFSNAPKIYGSGELQVDSGSTVTIAYEV